MPIQIGAKSATLNGVNYPPYTYIDWLSPADEALLMQGGDAFSVAARGSVSAYGNGTLGGSVLTIAAPDGTSVGDVLTATPSAGWTVASYQWTRDGADISGQTSSTYTLTLADEGALIGCRAGSPVYTALIEIPAGAYPPGYISHDGVVLYHDGAVLSHI